MNSERIFVFKTLILIKNKVGLMGKCKYLIILTEFMKPRGNLLRVWAKYQWGLKFVEKILKFPYNNLMGKLTFSIFYAILTDLCHFIEIL